VLVVCCLLGVSDKCFRFGKWLAGRRRFGLSGDAMVGCELRAAMDSLSCSFLYVNVFLLLVRNRSWGLIPCVCVWRAVKQRMSRSMNDSIRLKCVRVYHGEKKMRTEQREIAALNGGKFDRGLALVNKELGDV
jgi:hypothetical protein